MTVQLFRRRRIILPRGIGLWLLFLVWIVASAFTLYVKAPSAMPGGGAERVMVYGYRLSLYLTCTVALLWVVNTSASKLRSRYVAKLLGYMFLVTVLGGLLGVLWPTLEFKSLVEMILPGRISTIPYIHTLVHPGVADIQTVLGYPEARPKAPFSYANEWGANISRYLPFFAVVCFAGTKRWQRVTGAGVLIVALIPIVHSLNRGLWAALGIGVLFLVVRQILKGRLLTTVATTLIVVFGIGTLVMSPLGDMINSRLDHPHSNNRRYQLAVATVESAARGSPIVGYGTTRELQGNFTSIAGGARPNCPGCAAPPLGTQGQLWLVIFSQGFGGMLFYLAFLAAALARSWRCRTTIESVCTCVLLFALLEMFIYGTVGMPLLTVMLAIGLMWREQHDRPITAGGAALLDHRAKQRILRAARSLPALAIFALVGGIAGALWSATGTPPYEARASLLLSPSPTYLTSDTSEQESPQSEPTTVDTEATLLMASSTLAAARITAGEPPDNRLHQSIHVTAVPNTTVLTLHARANTPERAHAMASAVATTYLTNRHDYLLHRRQAAVRRLRQQAAKLDDGRPAITQPGGTPPSLSNQERAHIQHEIINVLDSSTYPGKIIRQSESTPMPRRYAVSASSGAAVGLLLGVLLSLRLPLSGKEIDYEKNLATSMFPSTQGIRNYHV